MSSLIYMKVLMDYVEGQNKNKTYICLMQDHDIYIVKYFFDRNYYIPIQFI